MKNKKISWFVILCGLMVLTITACVTTAGPPITIPQGDIMLLEGDTETLDYVLPEEASGTETEVAADEAGPVWKSADSKIAVVTPKGMVVALKEGTTVITVSANGFSGSVKVTVIKPTVRFENIWISKILYEKDGKAMYGTPLASDPASQWVIEDYKDYKRIRNKATGHYLTNENGNEYVECLDVNESSAGSQWKMSAGSIAGGTTFQSVLEPGYYLHVEQKMGFAQCNDSVQPEWTSPQWKVIKLDISQMMNGGDSEPLDTLVKNGNFSLTDKNIAGIGGMKGSSYWAFDGKGKTKLEDGMFRVDMEDSSPDTGSVKLSQSPVSLEKGKIYVISFMARAQADRSIAVKVSGSSGEEDYTGGGPGGTEITLNTEMNQYSHLFKMEGDTDAGARLEFLLGGMASSSIWIDDVMLEEFSMEEKVKNGGFSIQDPDVEKIKYVANSSYWFFGYDMGGAGGYAIPSLDNGAFKANVMEAGSAVYAVQLIQNPITFVQGVEYRVSFDARASEPRTIDVKAGGMGGRNWADYTMGEGVGQIISIGKKFKTYKFDFVMQHATDNEARLEFQLGGVAPSEVWLDNISVKPIKIAEKAKDEDDITVWVPREKEIKIPEIKARGASLPFVSYEAENAATNGQVTGPERAGWTASKITSEALGRKAVQLSKKGDYVEFKLKKEANSLVIRYSIPDTKDGKGQEAPISLYVDGKMKKEITLTSEFAWIYGNFPGANTPSLGMARRFFDEVSFLMDKAAAGSKVRLQKDASNDIVYTIDVIDAEQVPAPVSRPSGYLSVTDYGAMADDGKDDSDALNDCFTAAQRAKKGVWIPAGTFNVRKDNDLYPDGVVVQGAGMWYTKIQVGQNGFYGSGIPFTLRDLMVNGSSIYRDDSILASGVHGRLGKKSLVENVWFNHLKVGMWTEKKTDGLVVKGCRFRNLLADGINLCLGTKNSIVEQCHFRGTGDDAIATWSATYNNNREASSGNTIRFNTIQSPWLANGIAVYGGSNHVVEDNVISDIVHNGGGINISSNFDPVPFSGDIIVRRNTLIRCGADNSQQGRSYCGAFWIWCANQDIDANILVSDLDIYDSTYAGITIQGRKVLKSARFENILIKGVGTYGIHIMPTAEGKAVFTRVVVEDPRLDGLLDKGNMEIVKEKNNKGW
ncbi:MAG: carbohydrate binding domain-containing protein [Spirochaetales bacterium]|nr:carbohydrate binding domain-containing protein [Spirochaetales bacterium]